MGILLMNVNAFAMPFAAYDDPAAYGPMRWPDVALWAVEFVAVDGKLRAIFSALFGAGLLLVAERAEAGGRNAARVNLARLGTLLPFGLLHACLVWEGDILVLYALVGLAALPLRRLPVERLLVAAGLLLAAQGMVLAMHYQALAVLQEAAVRPDATPAAAAAWRAMRDAIGAPSPGALAADLALHRGPWAALAAQRIGDAPAVIGAELLFAGPETLGLMLLGMAGLKSGFLAGRWSRASYRRAARWAYLVAIPPLIAMALGLIAAGFPRLAAATLTDLAALPFRWAAAAGHVCLVLLWFGRGESRLRARIAAAGRTAFTNYLGTSLVMAALFQGWGLGWYGRVERWALLPIVLAAWAAMLAWSGPWLRRHAHGPFEWAWRSLARGRPAPWRIAIATGSHTQ